MDDDFYLSLQSPSEGIYKEKNSKFFSFAFPVSSPEEIKDLLSGFKKKYYDARHICYAYILGPKKDQYKAHDDGEPAHTAGDPILNTIRSYNITNVIVIVVRYFGGTKLGASGLIQAYKEAAEACIKNSKIIEKGIGEFFYIRFEYPEMNNVMKVLKNTEATILKQDTGNFCTITFEVRKKHSDRIRKDLAAYLTSPGF